MASASADDAARIALRGSLMAANSSGPGSSDRARSGVSPFFFRRFGGAYASSAGTPAADTGGGTTMRRRPMSIRTGFQRSVTAVRALAVRVTISHAPTPPNQARQ